MLTKEFDEAAWRCFAGCESWTNGMETLPLIGEGAFANGTRYCVVFDRTGACLLIEDDEINDFGGYCLELHYPTQAAAKAFAAGIGEPRHKLEFFLLGFKPA